MKTIEEILDTDRNYDLTIQKRDGFYRATLSPNNNNFFPKFEYYGVAVKLQDSVDNLVSNYNHWKR